ncbi:MAG: ABC transporter permease [Candidatus Liptonbacteria bacterium]|nr:ABC transporter permease [Candidatus Liptonbacteria bacterium]
MNPTRIYAIFIRQAYLIRDNPTRLFQTFIWITVDILLWGFVSKYLTAVAGSQFNFISVFLGAVLLWDFLIRVMQGITTSFFEDVWSRNFLNIFASPLSISEYITGLVLASVGTSVPGLILMLLLAAAVFGFSILIYGAPLLLFLAVLFLFGIALGILGVSIVLRWGPSAEWFVWPIPAVLSPFVGVLYPLATLPHWMQYIGQLLPPSYVFSGIRSIVDGGGVSVPMLAWGIVTSLAYIFLAYGVFVVVYRKAVRTGLIARYSAENVN